MAELVSLEQAKGHARITHDGEDDVLQALLTGAQAIVLEHVDQRIDEADEWSETVAAWTEEDVPDNVRIAILMQFAAMSRFRGDDEAKASNFDENGLAPGVTALLRRFRDPALA